MIFKRCSDVDFNMLHEVFSTGFSDYVITFVKPSLWEFKERFFGAEGNMLESSFIALAEDGKAVGLALGGIREFQGVKTLRCGGMCVIPEYRRQGISRKLLQLLNEEAVNSNCRQFMLEVITHNHKAVEAYEKFGFNKCYNLYYYTLEDINILNKYDNKNEIKELQMKDLAKVKEIFEPYHLNWQNSFEYSSCCENIKNYGIYDEHTLIAFLSIRGEKIMQLWVQENYRNKGVASSLIYKAALLNNISKVYLTFSNSSSVYNFVRKNSFSKDGVEQYEMYMPL
ncbi:GNAT family N-acetyltransferase [Clostridium polynesiense]|uniref:GNAT family N-acetyltransferase n=1 Tax=Clostridium polynesiense TaxID=1325933 RepID=UPI00058B6B33|nr:GNAT family N-acetyltransferase [Clostridium polynesiense]